jgi:hypothetical protein
MERDKMQRKPFMPRPMGLLDRRNVRRQDDTQSIKEETMREPLRHVEKHEVVLRLIDQPAKVPYGSPHDPLFRMQLQEREKRAYEARCREYWRDVFRTASTR